MLIPLNQIINVSGLRAYYTPGTVLEDWVNVLETKVSAFEECTFSWNKTNNRQQEVSPL